MISCSKAVEELIPETEVAIELGGEDAKITFYGATIEQRMNGTCDSAQSYRVIRIFAASPQTEIDQAQKIRDNIKQ